MKQNATTIPQLPFTSFMNISRDQIPEFVQSARLWTLVLEALAADISPSLKARGPDTDIIGAIEEYGKAWCNDYLALADLFSLRCPYFDAVAAKLMFDHGQILDERIRICATATAIRGLFDFNLINARRILNEARNLLVRNCGAELESAIAVYRSDKTGALALDALESADILKTLSVKVAGCNPIALAENWVEFGAVVEAPRDRALRELGASVERMNCAKRPVGPPIRFRGLRQRDLAEALVGNNVPLIRRALHEPDSTWEQQKVDYCEQFDE
jgi:hypothetical protein